MAALWGAQSMLKSVTPLSDTDLSKEAENPVTYQTRCRCATRPRLFNAAGWAEVSPRCNTGWAK